MHFHKIFCLILIPHNFTLLSSVICACVQDINDKKVPDPMKLQFTVHSQIISKFVSSFPELISNVKGVARNATAHVFLNCAPLPYI